MRPFWTLQCISFLFKPLIMRGKEGTLFKCQNLPRTAESVQTGFKMGYTQFHILSQVLCLLCHRQLQYLYHPHLLSLCCHTCHPPISECLAFYFLAPEAVYCPAFCLQSPQLNNLFCPGLGFYLAKEFAE